jgi:hypothetical protein
MEDRLFSVGGRPTVFGDCAERLTLVANSRTEKCSPVAGPQAKSSGNATNVLRTLELDAAISVRYFLKKVLASFFIGEDAVARRRLPVVRLVGHGEIAVLTWHGQGVLWSALIGNSTKPGREVGICSRSACVGFESCAKHLT